MRTPIFQLDAFTTRRFAGNPAAVMPMDSFPADALLQAIAAENNLAETAFLVPEGGDYRLRWFTPAVEVPLCGHATLASAAVVMERLEPARSGINFHSASGPLKVSRSDAGYVMDFPARPSGLVSTPRSSPKRWASLQLRFSSTPSITWLCSRAPRSCLSLLLIWRRSPAWTGRA
jgi:PhzF family phenazine biosynthesis protein